MGVLEIVSKVPRREGKRAETHLLHERRELDERLLDLHQLVPAARRLVERRRYRSTARADERLLEDLRRAAAARLERLLDLLVGRVRVHCATSVVSGGQAHGRERERGPGRTDEHVPSDLVPHALPLRALDPLPLLHRALQRLLERIPVPALGLALDLPTEDLDPTAVRRDARAELRREGRELDRERLGGRLERVELLGLERVERRVEVADVVADAGDLQRARGSACLGRRRSRRRRMRTSSKKLSLARSPSSIGAVLIPPAETACSLTGVSSET